MVLRVGVIIFPVDTTTVPISLAKTLEHELLNRRNRRVFIYAQQTLQAGCIFCLHWNGHFGVGCGAV